MPCTFCWLSYTNTSTEKNLLEHKDKIPEEVKADVQKAIDELKAVMESEDADDIKEKVQALQVNTNVCAVANLPGDADVCTRRAPRPLLVPSLLPSCCLFYSQYEEILVVGCFLIPEPPTEKRPRRPPTT